MYKLYWEAASGAILPQVMLEEIGQPYSKIHIDMARQQHRDAEFRRINPVMRIPALTLPDGATIGETAAMAIVLAERHPDSNLAPAPGEPDRPFFLFWLTAMATSGYPTFSRACHPEQFTNDDSANDSVKVVAERQLGDFFDVLEGAIEGKPWMMSRGYTALDIYIAMLTEWIGDKQTLFAIRPRLAALCDAVSNRASYRKVAQDHGLLQPIDAV